MPYQNKTEITLPKNLKQELDTIRQSYNLTWRVFFEQIVKLEKDSSAKDSILQQ